MAQEYLTMNKGVTLKKLDPENYLLYDLTTKQHLIGNEQFFELVLKCDGTRTIDNIIRETLDQRTASEEAVSSKANEIISRLISDGILNKTDRSLMQKIRIIDRLVSPPLNTVYWEVTNVCNFSCIHCYNNGTNKVTAQSPYETIDELEKSGVMDVLITGGEPFMVKSLPAILSYIKKSGLDFGLFTNGSLIDEEIMWLLKELNPKFMAVSFDSYRQEVFEMIRGPHYHGVLSNLQKMVQMNLPIRVNTVLFKGINDSLHQIEEHLKFIRDIGIKADNISIDEFLPFGAGEGKSFLVDPLETVKKIDLAYQKIFGMPFVVIQDKGDLVLDSYCGLGTTVCYLKADGRVALCPVLSDEGYVAGDLRQQPLLEIWSNSPIFDKLRDKSNLLGNECHSCRNLSLCAGGCKAKSQVFNSTFSSPDKWMCAYFGKNDSAS